MWTSMDKDKDASTVNESNRPVASCRVVRNEKELMSYQPTAMSTTVPSVCIGQKVLPLPDSAVTADTNIHRENDDFNSEEFTRTPSYLKVSRAISGYGLYNHYGWYKNIEKRSPCSSSISLRSVSSRELPNVSSQETCVSNPLVESPLHQEHILNGHSAKQMVSGHLEHIYPTGDPVKDGNYYLDITQTEEECLLALIGRTQKDMAGSNLTEEVHGKMRAAVGKANLLIGKKFQQFRQLCELHMNPSETERCTKWDDLQGFWDMVKIQVEDVDEMFMELNYMKQNDWKEIDFKSQVSSTNSSPKSGSISLSNASTPSATPGHTPGSKRKVIKVKDTIDASPERSQKAKQTAKLREEARKRMLAERRSAMKQKSQQALQEVEIFVPVTNTS